MNQNSCFNGRHYSKILKDSIIAKFIFSLVVEVNEIISIPLYEVFFECFAKEKSQNSSLMIIWILWSL